MVTHGDGQRLTRSTKLTLGPGNVLVLVLVLDLVAGYIGVYRL